MVKTNKKKEPQSVQEYLNLADVKGNVLYTKNGLACTYILVQPLSVELMTKEEKRLITKKISLEISELHMPFKLFFLSRPADVRKIISYYEEIKNHTESSIRRENLNKTIKYISNQSVTGSVLERQSYICLWKPRSEEKELMELTYEFKQALMRCKYQCEICDENQIVQMCSLALNPTAPDYTGPQELVPVIPVIGGGESAS